MVVFLAKCRPVSLSKSQPFIQRNLTASILSYPFSCPSSFGLSCPRSPLCISLLDGGSPLLSLSLTNGGAPPSLSHEKVEHRLNPKRTRNKQCLSSRTIGRHDPIPLYVDPELLCRDKSKKVLFSLLESFNMRSFGSNQF